MGPLYRTTLPMTPREVADRPERAVHRLGRVGTLHPKRVLMFCGLGAEFVWPLQSLGVGQGLASRTSQRVTDTKCQPGAPLTFSVERIMGVEGHPTSGRRRAGHSSPPLYRGAILGAFFPRSLLPLPAPGPSERRRRRSASFPARRPSCSPCQNSTGLSWCVPFCSAFPIDGG